MSRSTFGRAFGWHISLVLVLLIGLAGVPFQQAHADISVRFVRVGGTGDCSTWANACGLQTALTGASSGQQVWVAVGTYKPGTTRTDTFQLKNGVIVYGGFPATGNPLMADRNPGANLTTLSGDIGTVGYISDNSYHVVTGVTGATLDGFTIMLGNADNAVISHGNQGGGMLNVSSGPTLANVIFNGNDAGRGGGMYNSSSGGTTDSPTLTNVTFTNNTASGQGGGMYNDYNSPVLSYVAFTGNATGAEGGGMYNWYSDPALTNVSFTNNSAVSGGGGMANISSSPTLTRVTFSVNTSPLLGGGMLNFSQYPNFPSGPVLTAVTFTGNTATVGGGGMTNDANSSPALTNVTFSGNSASYGGGMMNDSTLSPDLNILPTLTNVTFAGNSASVQGGGMYNDVTSAPEIHNTIFWGNTAPDGAQIYNDSTVPVVSDSVIQGGYAGGTGIITADPLLGTLGSYGSTTQTIPLLPGSSAIDAGNASYCTTGHDQRGVAYVGACDIGAFESRGFTLSKTGGDNQSALLNMTFTLPLVVSVTANAAIEPVNGGKVTLAAPSSGASLSTPSYTLTISSGQVSQSVTANGVFGSYGVTVSAAGAASVNFRLTNGYQLFLPLVVR